MPVLHRSMTARPRRSRRTRRRHDGRRPDGRFTAEGWRRYCRGRGGRARAKALTQEQLSAIGRLGAATRWNPQRAARGLALLPVPDVPEVQTSHAVEMRRRRDLGRRRAKYDGIAYRDSMASDPAIRRALEEERDQ